MALRGSQSSIQASAWRGVSLSLGAAVLLGSGAVSAPLLAQTSGDVVVPTEPSTGGTTPTPSTGGSQTPLAGTRFSCQVVNGQYTVMYNPETQPGQNYPWAVPGVLGGGWSPERRCSEITRRLESYRPDGLVEMRTAVENGYNTICVTTQNVPSCRIVLTVPPGQDPIATRDRVFQNLTVADSGQQTQGVNTFTGGRDGLFGQLGQVLGIGGSNRSRSAGINLRPFLDRADGGTGEKLRSTTVKPSPRFNPRWSPRR